MGRIPMHLLRLHKLLCTALMAYAVWGAQALDDKTLIKLTDHGSTRLAEMERELEEVDKEQKEYANELKRGINEENRRCNAFKSAIRDLAPKVRKSGKIDLKDDKGRTLLMLVAGLGNDTATEMVLRDSPDLMAMDKDGRVAMDYEQMGGGTAVGNILKDRWNNAFTANNADEIQALLDCGANADWPVNGEPPLGLAIYTGNDTLFNILTMHGAHAGNRMSDGTTLVEMAVKFNNANALDYLLGALSETEIIFSDGIPVFRHLMSEDKADCLSAWIDQALSQKKMQTEDGTSYFCLVIRLADTACAIKVATNHLKLLSEEDAEGNLPLHEAARRGDAALYRELVKLGAEVEQKNSRGETVLMHAALSGDADTLAAVLENISPELLNATDKDGHTAHYYAKLAKDPSATEALNAAGLQPQKKN